MMGEAVGMVTNNKSAASNPAEELRGVSEGARMVFRDSLQIGHPSPFCRVIGDFNLPTTSPVTA